MNKLYLRCASCGRTWNVSRLRSASLVFICPDCEARQHARLVTDRRPQTQILSPRCEVCARTALLE